MPARNYKTEFGLAIEIYSVLIFMLNNGVIWPVNMKPQNRQMHGQISPRRVCNPCGYTMKMSSRYHRLLIYDVKRNSKIDGMGPFKLLTVLPDYNILHMKGIVAKQPSHSFKGFRKTK